MGLTSSFFAGSATVGSVQSYILWLASMFYGGNGNGYEIILVTIED